MKVTTNLKTLAKKLKKQKIFNRFTKYSSENKSAKRGLAFALLFAMIGVATLLYSRAATTGPNWADMYSEARLQALSSTLSNYYTDVLVPTVNPPSCTTTNKTLFKNYGRVLGKAKTWNNNPINLTLKTEINENLAVLSYCWNLAVKNTDVGWYDYEVNIPTALTDTLLIMGGDVSNIDANKYALQAYKAANERIDSKHTATNKTSVTRPILNVAIILNSHQYSIAPTDATYPYTILKKAASEIYNAFTIGNSNSFMQDGSFDFHGVASAGAYGEVLLRDVSRMLLILNKGQQDVALKNIIASINNTLYPKLFDAFEPVMHNGLFMDMVRGRDLTVKYANENKFKDSLINLYKIAPNNYKSRIGSWLNQVYPGSIATVSTEPARGGLNLYRHYPEINKSVWHQDSIAYGLSMHSQWKRSFETLNNDNKQGWYLSEGWLQLFDSDVDQYSSNWFPTIDRQRLPGTTVLYKTDLRSFKCDPANNINQTWVGGAGVASSYGVSGMDMNVDLKESCTEPYNAGIDLKAKKSYFFFDNEIVALGSNISSNNTNISQSVNTTIENRKLNVNNSNIFTVGTTSMPNGQVNTTILNTLLNVNWLHLSGQSGSQTGYFFPTATTIQTKRENRKESWSNIGQSIISKVGADIKNNNYLTAWIDHGKNPSNANYSYALLPGKTASEISGYSTTYKTNPQFKILKQDELAHAVFDKSTGITAINFWLDGLHEVTNSINNSKITSDNKAIVLTQHANNYFVVSVASPYRNGGSAGSNITLNINRTGGFTNLNNVCKDSRVSYSSTADNIKLSINTTAGLGATEPRGKAWIAVFNLYGGIINTKIATPTCSDSSTPPPALNVPTGLTVGTRTVNSIAMSWTASTDNVAVTGYKIYRAGSQIGTSTTTSYTDTGLTPNTPYSYTVSAYDGAGNNSAQTTALATSTLSDATAPSVPAGLSSPSQTTNSIALSWTASTDNVAVTGYKIFRAGSQIGTSITTSYTNTGLTQGTAYSYTVSAYDASGNNSVASTALVISTKTKMGDVNSDGYVDGGDFSLLALNYGKCGKTLAGGDLTMAPAPIPPDPGCVNVWDLQVLATYWGT